MVGVGYFLRDIGGGVKRYSVYKVGSTTYYVDATNGNDNNDGLSWKTAKKTIQSAIDSAEHWSTIYVNTAAYETYNTVGSDLSVVYMDGLYQVSLVGIGANVVRIGENNPTESNKYSIIITNSSDITVCNFNIASYHGVKITNSFNINIFNNNLLARSGSGIIITNSDPNAVDGHDISHNYIQSCSIGIEVLRGNYIKIYENNFDANNIGVKLGNGTELYPRRNTIFHNNFVDNTTNAVDLVSDFVGNVYKNWWYENYWSDHSNIDNGFGICTEPYVDSYTEILTGTIVDNFPLSMRNGWNLISLQRSILRKNTYGYESNATGVTFNGTTWVDLFSKTVTVDTKLTGIKMTTSGTFAGTPKYRIIRDGSKVFPYNSENSIESGVLREFEHPINIPINSSYKVQVRSTDAGDTTQTVVLDELDKIEIV